jgi:hypothetical protein
VPWKATSSPGGCRWASSGTIDSSPSAGGVGLEPEHEVEVVHVKAEIADVPDVLITARLGQVA